MLGYNASLLRLLLANGHQVLVVQLDLFVGPYLLWFDHRLYWNLRLNYWHLLDILQGLVI